MRSFLHTLVCFIFVSIFLLVGCRWETSSPADRASESTTQTEPREPPSSPSTQKRDRRFEVAAKAKDALFQTLSGRLKEVLQTKGPAAAIEVCQQEAPKLAESVGDQFGVRIGRTSFKLRNPANAPRDWVKPFVEQRVDTIERVELDSGDLGVLFPIHLNVKCLICHGGPEDVLDEVRTELAERYPTDHATGFKVGDLRGWFWVEVPKTSTPDSADKKKDAA